MELKDILLMRKLSGIPQPTVADAGKTPVVDQNGKYQLTDLGVGISYEVVSELPSEGEAGVIYLVANGAQSGTNIYDEYIWTGSAYEKIGTMETPPQVIVMTGLLDNVSQQANAERCIAEMQAGKVVVTIHDHREYILTRADADTVCFSAIVASRVLDKGDRAFVFNCIRYNSDTNRFDAINENLYLPTVRLLPGTSGASSGAVYRDGLTAYVDFPGKFLPINESSYPTRLCGVSDVGEVHWLNIKPKSLDQTQGDVYNLVMYAIMVAESTGTATVGANGSSFYETASLVLSFWGGKNPYSGEPPFINFGKYVGRVIGCTDTDISVKCAGYDATNNYFIEFTLVGGVDTSGGEGNETGYYCVHVIATQPTPPPSA